jgi:hypothetical protein
MELAERSPEQSLRRRFAPHIREGAAQRVLRFRFAKSKRAKSLERFGTSVGGHGRNVGRSVVRAVGMLEAELSSRSS